MVTTIIRRTSGLAIKRQIKRELISTSKTGIHPNEIVNQAIDQIEQNEVLSGSGISIASNTVPWLLKKRRAISDKAGLGSPERDTSTIK